MKRETRKKNYIHFTVDLLKHWIGKQIYILYSGERNGGKLTVLSI